MLQVSQSITNKPVLSVRTGSAIAMAAEPIINPNNLKVEGWYCNDYSSKQRLILQTQDVRDILPEGIVVDDLDALSDPEDLVRMQQLLHLNFTLMGKPVFSVNKKSLGKVTDFALELGAFYIQKLYVEPSLLKSIGSSSLVVDRTQIVEITNRKIVIQDPLKPVKSVMPAPAAPAS
jgi:sporulation protein YlmC with PRC-barrel domain